MVLVGRLPMPLQFQYRILIIESEKRRSAKRFPGFGTRLGGKSSPGFPPAIDLERKEVNFQDGCLDS